MKKNLIGFTILAIALIAYGIFYFFGRYKSAFEADQQCHYQKYIANVEATKIDCDHDLETRQWILFEIGENNSPAKVITRFRY